VEEDEKFEFEEENQRKVRTAQMICIIVYTNPKRGDHSHSSIIIYRKCI
jgi:hypothetical protein